MTQPLFHPNFGNVPVGPDHPCWGQSEQVAYAIQPWNYFRSIPTHMITVSEHLRQTDKRTIYCGTTALRVASRDKKCIACHAMHFLSRVPVCMKARKIIVYSSIVEYDTFGGIRKLRRCSISTTWNANKLNIVNDQLPNWSRVPVQQYTQSDLRTTISRRKAS